MCIAIIALGFIIPVLFVYLQDVSAHERAIRDYMLTALYVVDPLLVFDIGVTFRTGSIQNDGTIVTRPRHIAFDYATSWLLFDLLSAWPVSFHIGHEDERFSVLLTVFMAFKLVRVAKLNYLLSTFESFIGHRQTVILSVTIALTLCTHLLACCWRLAQAGDPLPDDPLLGTSASEAWWERYISDVYFVFSVVTSVGFGDIHALGTVGRIFSIFCMSIGSAFCGFIIMTFSQFFKGILYNDVEIQVRQARTFMQARGVPGDLRRRVEYSLRHRLTQETSTVTSTLLSQLTGGVRADLALELLATVVGLFPLFDGGTSAFAKDLAAAHQWVTALSGDIVVEEGQLVHELIFLIQGHILLLESASCSEYSEPEMEVSETSLRPGAWIGEGGLFDREHVRLQTAVATTHVELAVLPIVEFHKIAHNHPKMAKLVVQMEKAAEAGTLKIDFLKWVPPAEEESTPNDMWKALNILRSSNTSNSKKRRSSLEEIQLKLETS
jgi:hypothetical protein